MIYKKQFKEKKIELLLTYTKQKIYFRNEYGVKLTYTNAWAQIESTTSSRLQFTEAVSYLNVILGFQVHEYDRKNTYLHGQSENEYYKILSDRDCKRLMMNSLIIPQFAIREILSNQRRKLPYFLFCISDFFNVTKQSFLRVYQQIGCLLSKPQQQNLTLNFDEEIVLEQNIAKFIGLKLLKIRGMEKFNYRIENNKILSHRCHAEMYTNIAGEYCVQALDVSLRAYFKIITDDNFVQKSTKSMIFHEIEMIEEINKDIDGYKRVREDKIYYIRHKNSAAFKDLHSASYQEQNTIRYLILPIHYHNFENQIKNLIEKQIKNTVKELRYQFNSKNTFMQLCYRSNYNCNERIYSLYRILLKKVSIVYKIAIDAEISQAIQKVFYHSGLVKLLEQQLKLQWKLTSNQKQYYISFSRCLVDPAVVLKKVTNFVHSFQICNFIVTPQSSIDFERMRSTIEKLQFQKLTQATIRQNIQDQYFIISGLTLHKHAEEETLVQLDKFLKQFDLDSDDCIIKQTVTFKQKKLSLVQSNLDLPEIPFAEPIDMDFSASDINLDNSINSQKSLNLIMNELKRSHRCLKIHSEILMQTNVSVVAKYKDRMTYMKEDRQALQYIFEGNSETIENFLNDLIHNLQVQETTFRVKFMRIEKYVVSIFKDIKLKVQPKVNLVNLKSWIIEYLKSLKQQQDIPVQGLFYDDQQIIKEQQPANFPKKFKYCESYMVGFKLKTIELIEIQKI